jgi:hypothetical protein
MPLPRPTSEETKGTFLARAMSDLEMIKEFPDEKQRYAVALELWEKKFSEKASWW